MTQDNRTPELKRFVDAIEQYERKAQTWHKRCEKIEKRYLDDRKDNERDDRTYKFNALWANIQSLQPALYARLPKPEVERRFLDQDKLGRYASEVLQRALTFQLEENGHSQIFRQTVLDYLLTARGTTWVRYVPHIVGDEPSETPAAEKAEEGALLSNDAEIEQEITWEETAIDFVGWRDFGHSEALTWPDVGMVWRRVYLDREELNERFGEELGAKIPLNYGQQTDDQQAALDKDQKGKKAVIYEIADKSTKTFYWISKDYPEVLDSEDDPLGLEGFFPCPRPLFGTLVNSSLIPTPDFVLYQDQAIELDDLSQRIAMLNRALKVAGVYNKECVGVERLLNEGIENQMIPVDSWAIFAEKGGLKGSVDWFPVDLVMEVRNGLEEAFMSCKARMDEITGINDLRRGDTNPNETATAQQLKANYSGLRLRDRQAEVQRFIRDNVHMCGQIIANFFSVDSLKAMTGVKMLDSQAQKQAIQAQLQQAAMMAQQAGQPPQAPPEEIADMQLGCCWVC